MQGLQDTHDRLHLLLSPHKGVIVDGTPDISTVGEFDPVGVALVPLLDDLAVGPALARARDDLKKFIRLTGTSSKRSSLKGRDFMNV